MVQPARVLSLSPAAPFLKWAGGKRQLLAALLERVPRGYGCYHEPFLGGGALYFALQPSRARLQDLNADLIATYEVVRDEVEPLLVELAALEERTGPEAFYAIRTEWNERKDELSPVERAARFLFLNKRGFNGLWRENARGFFNVPAGRSTSRRLVDPEGLRVASAVLAGATLRASPFETVLEQAAPGDFVYLDPPYHPLSETSQFTAYQSAGFTARDQERLRDLFVELVRRGCRVMLSNSDCAFVRSLYEGFLIERVLATRMINSDATARGAIPELIIRSYGEASV